MHARVRCLFTKEYVAVYNRCGISNGHAGKVPGRGGGEPSGVAGSNLPRLPNNETTWKAGATAEVAWSLYVNHGGGCESRCIVRVTHEFA